MNAKTALSCLLGVLMLMLTACGSADLMREKDRENVNLRRQVEQLRAQVQAKEDEARKLADQLAEAKKLQTQVMALEDRLRVMDDMMMAKSEDLAKMEAQLAAAKPARARKGKPAKAKAEAATPNVDMIGKAAEPAMKAPAGDAKAPAADAKP
jgi:septal ring factor EnvC (AmiA/AmiB activator)